MYITQPHLPKDNKRLNSIEKLKSQVKSFLLRNCRNSYLGLLKGFPFRREAGLVSIVSNCIEIQFETIEMRPASLRNGKFLRRPSRQMAITGQPSREPYDSPTTRLVQVKPAIEKRKTRQQWLCLTFEA